METTEVHISNVFEESSCCLCGRSGVDQYLKIYDNFIKYNKKLVSFLEVIKKTLDYEPTRDLSSMEICEVCKGKLVEFYHFKLRSEQVRKMTSEFTEIQEDDSIASDKIVYSTVQIVRNYIQKYSIAEIQTDKDQKRLIIMPKSVEMTVEPTEVFRIDIKTEELVGDFIEEDEEEQVEVKAVELEMESEYLEDCDEAEYELVAEETLESKDDDTMDTEADDTEIVAIEEDPIFAIEEADEIIFKYDSDSSTPAHPESSSDTPNTSKSSRHRNPENWACNKRKTLRNLGKTYLNTKGKLVEAKKMRESCGTLCRAKCITKVTEEDRQAFFNTFWGLGDVVRQRKFLFKHMTSNEPKRRRAETSNRNMTLHFYIDVKTEIGWQLVQVCKKMFKNTLVISSQIIAGVMKKYAIEGFADSRGKFERKVSPAQGFAIDHVKRFPYFYIENTMTKVQCYQMYVDECREKGLDPIKEGNYRDIFDKQNQSRFLKTEKIACEYCHKFNQASDEEKAQMQKDFDEHISVGVNKRCRDRALGKIRHRRAQERKRIQRQAERMKQEIS